MGSVFSDNELINGLVSRDPMVIREYYDRFYEGIRKFIRYNRGNDEDARDIFHDALLVLFQKVRNDDFKLSCSPGTYLYSVSKNLWLKELGKRKWTKVNTIDLENYIDPGSDINDIYDKNERLIFFRKIFDELPEDCRKVLSLFIKGHSITEITEIMGYGSEQYTRNRRYRCKLTLIKSIKSVFE